MKISQQSIQSSGKNKPYNIMVTGATGFIGARLLSHISKLGYSVKGMSRREPPNNANVKYLQANVFDV